MTKKIGPGVITLRAPSRDGIATRDRCRTSPAARPVPRRRRGGMDSVRLVQCTAAGCGEPFFLCSPCDRGQIYCQPCRAAARLATRRASRRRYWRSPKGRRKTAARVGWHREPQNVTHARRREVGLPSTVAAPSAPVVTERRDEEWANMSPAERELPSFWAASLSRGRLRVSARREASRMTRFESP
jgi:hypothetical protein